MLVSYNFGRQQPLQKVPSVATVIKTEKNDSEVTTSKSGYFNNKLVKPLACTAAMLTGLIIEPAMEIALDYFFETSTEQNSGLTYYARTLRYNAALYIPVAILSVGVGLGVQKLLNKYSTHPQGQQHHQDRLEIVNTGFEMI